MPRIIAEANDLLVIDKPAGLIVHSDGRTEEPSVAEWIAREYPGIEPFEYWVSPQGARVSLPGIVHRLDRTTSGVMLIAKTYAMYEYLKIEFKARRIEKTYFAFVYGNMEEGEGTIVAEIMRSGTPPRKWYARPTNEGDPRAAITSWKLLKQLEGASYLEAKPQTGRTHQIRVHLASIGHPIVADHLYADQAPILGFVRPALHASGISLTLPSGEKTSFTAPLPADFQAALSR